MLQLCPTLCDPIDGSPPGFPVPGILQARTLEWVAISFSQCRKVKSESEVAQSCPTLSDPMDCSLPGSSVHGFSRQEYWSGVPLPSPNSGSLDTSKCWVLRIYSRPSNSLYLALAVNNIPMSKTTPNHSSSSSDISIELQIHIPTVYLTLPFGCCAVKNLTLPQKKSSLCPLLLRGYL